MREDSFRYPTSQKFADTPASFAVPKQELRDRPCAAHSSHRRNREGSTPSSSPPRLHLEAALAHVRGDPSSHTHEATLPWHVMFERQEQRLSHHAKENGLPTDWQPPSDARALPGGAEHHLWKGRDGRIYKMTKDDHFGQVPCHNPSSKTGWENFAAAPADYLERLTLMNEIFGDDLRIVGLRCGHTVAIATSQPLRKPARVRQPHPRTTAKIESFMEQRGFVNLGFAAWFHPTEKLMVTDATPDNFIETRHGLKPVDLMICHAQGKLLRLLQQKIASGQPNDELRLREEEVKRGK